AVSDRKNIPPALRAIEAVVYQPRCRIRVEECARDSGARQLEERTGLPRSCREADARGGAALAEGVASACRARLPLDGVVVELDVEVARTDVSAVYQHDLEEVENACIPGEAADARPVGAERGPTVDGARAERDHVTLPRVHVREEGRDDHPIRAGQAKRRE